MSASTRTSEASRVFGFVLLLAMLATVPSASGAGKRVALVIGNSAYPSAPLRNPINDARAMSKTLNQLGFEVILRTNLGQRGMIESLREFSKKLGQNGDAVFYYSGHGMQVKGRNYLIPVDADIRGEDEVPYMSLEVAQVLDKLEQARSRANIVILDACRNNPFARTFRSARTGLAQMDAPVGTLIAFATAPGSEARDGDGEFGTYTRHLLEFLPSPGLPVELMFRRVREAVTAETKDRQVPWESSSLRGDFLFNPGSMQPQPARAVPAQSVDSNAVELAFWNSIKDSKNPADFDAYLQQYPSGSFAPLARNRVQSGKPVPPSPQTPAPSAEPQASAPPSQLAMRAPDTAVANRQAGPLHVGDRWTYRFFDERQEATKATVTHEIIDVGTNTVTESLTLDDKSQKSWQDQFATGPRVVEQKISPDLSIHEFAPFLAAESELQVGRTWDDIPGLVDSNAYDRWRLSAKVVAHENVSVPAGKFNAYKVEFDARRPNPASRFEVLYVTRIVLAAWYAQETRRVVKTVRRTYNLYSEILDTDRYELVSFQLR